MTVHRPRILVVFHSETGQTAKIAQRVASRLRAGGDDVDVAEVESEPSPAGYDCVVVGDPIRVTHHSRAMTRFLRDHERELATMPSALFQVSLTSAHTDDAHNATAHDLVRTLLDDTGFDPDVVAMLAGSLVYTQYGWLKRWVMHAIAKREGDDTDTTRDYEYTDWEAVDAFAADVGALVRTSTPR
jgi:menaquinone-dependent protoporphyrinogen oxidase